MEQEKVPVQGQVAERTISLTASWAYFALSIVINSMGNVLTLVTSSHVHPQFLGSAYWTAAENNLGIAVLGNNSMTLFWAFMVLGMLTSILNAILMHKWDWRRIGGNFIFMLPFSIFIQWFSDIFNRIMPDATTLPMIILYVFINFLGVAFIGTAISIYQRVNLVLHPLMTFSKLFVSVIAMVTQRLRCGYHTFHQQLWQLSLHSCKAVFTTLD